MNYKSTHRNVNGFTLAELLVALSITAIISAAVATLAFAVSSANDMFGQASERQTKIRYSAIRIEEFIRNCRLVCEAGDDYIALWRADDDGDSDIDIQEIVFIDARPGQDGKINLFECTGSGYVIEPDLPDFDNYDIEATMEYYGTVRNTVLIDQCRNVSFELDAEPPYTRTVSISFEAFENDAYSEYEVNCYIRGWAGHLLNPYTEPVRLVSVDDDE